MVQNNPSAGNEEKREHCTLPRVIFIRATMHELQYPLLPFALLKKNPLIEMEQCIRMHNIDISNSTQLRSSWNTLFADISSDELYFVCAWNSVPEASSRMVQAAGLTFVIASCGPLHRRWLTTRPVLRNNGELVVWCEAIDMHAAPFEPVVTLSEANMIRLAPVLQLPERKVA